MSVDEPGAIEIGVGLPTGVPGATGRTVIDWAIRADAGPFAHLGVVDRVVYDSYDPLVALAAAAAVTRRVRLVTAVAVGPLRNTTLLAKAAASIHALSGGRLVLGLAVGARREDYEAAGIDHRLRGKRLDEQLGAIRTVWETPSIGPAVSGRPPTLLVGGTSDEAFARMARYADGYVHGGGPPRAFARAADKARAAWAEAGRPGRPQLWGQGYYALGSDDIVSAGSRYMRDYYAFTGPFVEKIVEGLLTTPQGIVQFAGGYADAGCDNLVLMPTVPHLDQLDALAAVLG